MRWIRWKGLLAFIAAVSLIAVFWFLLVDFLVKRGIEKTGTAIVGAKVELARADLSLFPLGLTLTGLQVTNPDSPMTNAFEAGKVAFTMDGLNLLRRKVIIDEMSVEGVLLNTPRKTSGEIKKGPRKEKPAEGPPLLTFEAPSVKDILAKENLNSVRVIKDLRSEVDKSKEKWQEELKGLPDRKKIEDYKKRIDKLKESGKDVGGAVAGAGEVLAIQEEIRKDLSSINAVKDGLESNLKIYKKLAEDAAKSPGEDINRIRNKYSLTPEGITNLSRYFIGGKLKDWFDKALGWYRRIEPVLKQGREEKGVEVVKPPRARGEYVRFKEYRPLPDFLVRKASVSVSLPIGDLKGLITNITPDQNILGAPLKFDFSGDKLKGLESVKLNGALNYIDPKRPKNTVAMDIKGLKIKNISLSEAKELLVVLKGGLADAELKAELAGNNIDANLSAGVKSADISVGRAVTLNPIEKAIASALSGVRGFNMKAGVTGTIDNYDLKVSSDFDRVLKDIVGKVVSEQAAELEKKLRAEVMKQVDGPLKELQGSLSGLDAIDSQLKELINQETGLLTEAGKKAAPGGLKLPKLPF